MDLSHSGFTNLHCSERVHVHKTMVHEAKTKKSPVRKSLKPTEESCFNERLSTVGKPFHCSSAWRNSSSKHVCKTGIVLQHEQTCLISSIIIYGRDRGVIKNLYWDQIAAMGYDNELGYFVKLKKGVRQGCVLSPDLFSLYSEYIMREIGDVPGITIGGHTINNLALIATS